MDSILDFKSGEIKSMAECFADAVSNIYNVLLNSLFLDIKNNFIRFGEINVGRFYKMKIVNNSHSTK